MSVDEAHVIRMQLRLGHRRADWRIALPAVLPGSYRVHLEFLDTEAESDEDVYRPLGEVPRVEVRPGETVTVELPPQR